jgi:predicted DNA-binding transcriptional regulator YafY
MTTNQQSLLRQWNMLRLLPRAPVRITAKELCDRLRAADFPVTKRTVERDLNELASVFPLVVDDREKPYGWSWQRDASGFDLPGLSIPDALTLTLVEQQLRNQLPPSALDALKPYFVSAAKTLSSVDDSVLSKAWLGKVRTIAPLQPLQPPRIDEACQRTVYLALMKDLQLKLHYRKRDAAEDTVYDSVHPLGVVQRGSLIYLVCTFAGYNDTRTLALHRVTQADIVHEPVRRRADFDLDEFIASGAFGFLTGGPIVLRATFKRAVGEHLYETPLSDDQVLVRREDDTLALTATVAATRTLVYWLTGFGAGVVVHAPAQLRAEMKQIAQEMAKVYNDTADTEQPCRRAESHG